MTTTSVTSLLNSTYSSSLSQSNSSNCDPYETVIQNWFSFDSYQLVKVVVTWVLFALSATGIIFVLISLRPTKRLNHFFMFHLALADLVYACTVLPIDAIWNTTMQWQSGHGLCKFAQMLKQFGMYASAFMVVVIAVDRVTTIVRPTTINEQKKRGHILVFLAWATSVLCTIPAGVVFSVLEVPNCEGILIRQCVDHIVVSESALHSYHFFTMFMSFLTPFCSSIVSYSLIICEISKMKERDRQLMGRRNSQNSEQIQKAINKTVLMRTLITVTFLVCWGPYYAIGIIDWFIRDINQTERPLLIYELTYFLMYFNCLLHPIVFGVFFEEVRENFISCLKCRFHKRPYQNRSATHFSRISSTPGPVNTNNNIVTYKKASCLVGDRPQKSNGFR